MNKLQQHVLDILAEDGYLPLDRYLALVIPYYYAHNHVFGRAGDFTTAPEISQLFGEMLGLWCVQKMLKAPDTHFCLLELGPGRGTLMQDVLRTIAKIPAARVKLKAVYLVENSIPLQKLQQQTLAHSFVPIKWHTDLSEVIVNDLPLLCLANEFFDALPIKQYIRTEAGLHEIVVMQRQGQVMLAQQPVNILDFPDALQVGDVWETSDISNKIAQDLACLLHKNRASAALLIDYGYYQLPKTPTLQAVKQHQYCNILDNIGEADISALVNFQELAACFQAARLGWNLHTQGEFLTAHGINERAAALINAGADAQMMASQKDRLCNPAQMGELFKVLEIHCANDSDAKVSSVSTLLNLR